MSFGKAKKQNNKIHIGSRAFDVFLIVFMIIVAIIFLYPFLNVIATSLSSNRMITTGQVTFFPKEFHLDGYKALFKDENILGAYWNTIVIAVGTMIVSLVLNSLMAYVMMAPEFVLRKPLSIILLITEAARIDGASEFQILTKIYVPLSKALYATFGLFSVVGVWNSYYEALLYIKDPAKQPIQMLLRKIVFTSNTSNMSNAQQMISNGNLNSLNVQYACVIATIGPILLVYPFIQKYFAQGVQVGAVKG